MMMMSEGAMVAIKCQSRTRNPQSITAQSIARAREAHRSSQTASNSDIPSIHLCLSPGPPAVAEVLPRQTKTMLMCETVGDAVRRA